MVSDARRAAIAETRTFATRPTLAHFLPKSFSPTANSADHSIKMFTKIPREMLASMPSQTRTAILAGGAIAILVFVIFWLAPSPQPAQAQVPDAGLQRDQMITELRNANRKLDEIATLLREIRDSKGDEKKPAPTARPAPEVKPASNPKPSPTVKPAPTAKPSPTAKSSPTAKPTQSRP